MLPMTNKVININTNFLILKFFKNKNKEKNIIDAI